MTRRLIAAMVARAATAPAAAGQPAVGGEDVPRIEIDDLPPLPSEDDTRSGAAVAAAAAAAAEEDVVVGAAKREQSLGNVASAVTVISGDRLRRMGYRTVAEALRGVAGVFVVDDHMNDRVGVRGLQVLGDFNTRILVLVDGATVNEPGEFILIYTDGVTEAQNAQGELFGIERLRQVILDHGAGSAGEFVSVLEKALALFTGDVAPFDDITLVAVKRL